MTAQPTPRQMPSATERDLLKLSRGALRVRLSVLATQTRRMGVDELVRLNAALDEHRAANRILDEIDGKGETR